MRPFRKSFFVCVLLSALLVAGCGSSGKSGTPASMWLTPGSTPLARPGTHVWAVGMPRLVVTSANGGASWRVSHRDASGDMTYQLLRGVAFGDAQHGWAVGKAGTILATTDGGASWSSQRWVADENLADVAAIDAKHAWAVGLVNKSTTSTTSLILATSDGGKTWRTQYDKNSGWLAAVAFANAKHGWAVGWGGDILATSDGGSHWRVQRHMEDLFLSDVTFTDVRHGWIVGGAMATNTDVEPGFILATSDGGAHWRMQLSGTHDILTSVCVRRRQQGLGRGQRRCALPHDRWRCDLDAEPPEPSEGLRRRLICRRQAWLDCGLAPSPARHERRWYHVGGRQVGTGTWPLGRPLRRSV